MSDEQRLAERVVSAMLAKDAFSQWLGIEVLDVRPSGATVRMEVRPEMQNGFGVCHGAIPFALADSALAFASNTHGNITLSIENSITYPKPIAVGDVLIAKADEESASKRLAFYRVAVERGTEVVALFRGTVYRTNQPLIADPE
ncbi:MAG TPA: hotdog fold thioesterase [Gemmatimonadaceae bacterium]|nr:hotdog fold thioesterase [Gemmatimonadaceae bacterium]